MHLERMKCIPFYAIRQAAMRNRFNSGGNLNFSGALCYVSVQHTWVSRMNSELALALNSSTLACCIFSGLLWVLNVVWHYWQSERRNNYLQPQGILGFAWKTSLFVHSWNFVKDIGT